MGFFVFCGEGREEGRISKATKSVLDHIAHRGYALRYRTAFFAFGKEFSN